MKPPAAGAKATLTSSSSRQGGGGGGGSHIPLPLRKGSTKLDKTQDGDNECNSEDCDRPRAASSSSASRGRRGNQERRNSSGGKMSLLGGTSFCCASGQKDDIRDSQSIPVPQKRKMKNAVVKRETIECSAPESATSTPPVMTKKVATPKGRRPKVENDTVDDSHSKDFRHPTEDFGCRNRVSAAEEKVPSRSVVSDLPLQDNRLKYPDTAEKRKSSTAHLQSLKDVCTAAGQRKDNGSNPEMTAVGKQHKYTEVLRKLRKDPAHCTPNNIMALNVENKLYEKSVTNEKKVNDPVVEVSLSEGISADSCDRKAISEENQVDFSSQRVVNNHPTQSSASILKEPIDRSLSPGHVDDLDCPCCDNSDNISHDALVECSSTDRFKKDSFEEGTQPVSANFALKDGGVDCEVLIAKTSQLRKEEGTEDEVEALKEELKQEKLRLQSQQERVLQLEKEVKVMEQLKRELSKEQKLRKEAEETLLQILNHGNMLEQDQQQQLLQLGSHKSATDSKNIESGRNAFPDTDEDNSSLLLGYESRIRRYQLYISKLEKDNLTLIRELKQFKDLSPCSQQEQAKALLGKVTQLERDNQQQQVQYECCLDEVANRLVHTLLAQKHLEEECSTLHAKVEQLETDNRRLLDLVSGEEETKDGTLRTSSQSEAFHCVRTGSEHSSDDSLTKESVTRLLKKCAVGETARYTSAKHVKTCKVPPTRHQKTLIPEDHAPLLSFRPLSASKIASSFDKTSRTQHPHPQILNNQTHSPADDIEKQTPIEVSSPVQRNTTNVTTKCSSVSSVPNSSRLKSPTIHLSFKEKTSSATDDTRFSGVKRKRPNRVLSEKGMKELHEKKYPSMSLDKHQTTQRRSHAHSESSAHLEIALQSCNKSSLLLDESFSDSDEVFIFSDSPKNISYDAFCVFPSSSDHQGIYLEDGSGKVFSPVHETDNSVSTVHRTRDEGYSTMSSDLQPDSAADTTVSEQDDHSATYIASESGQRCSDDSITECLDGSMSSSSDSGFGPLNCIAGDLLSARFPNTSFNSESQLHSKDSSTFFSVNGSTEVKSMNDKVELLPQQSSPEVPSQELATIIPDSTRYHSSEELSHNMKNVHQLSDNSIQSSEHSNSLHRHSAQTEVSDFCEDSSNSETTTIIPPHESLMSNQESQSASPHLHNVSPSQCSQLKESSVKFESDDSALCLQAESVASPTEDKIVLTAEKATLTEPEELMWREKALAQYIDESIWSLYSSESDIQVKYSPETFRNQTEEEVPSRSYCLPRSKTHNCITLSEELAVDYGLKQTHRDADFTSVFKDKYGVLSTSNAMTEMFDNNNDDNSGSVLQHSLERVASDTVLHLKTTFQELETSMKSSLKTSKDITNKNIPLVHHLSISNINNLGLSLAPDNKAILLTEPKFLQKSDKQELTANNLWWPSPTDVIKSSSLSSLQSSLSYQAVSDEMEDDDVHHVSRKGSQDPDLSSASDTDYINLDHKDFVEQWLQKEISEKNTTKGDEGCETVNSGHSKREAARKQNAVPRCYQMKSTRNFVANQNELSFDLCHRLEEDRCFREALSEARGTEVRLQSSSLETTPNSLENYYMGEVSAMYADACESYARDNQQPKNVSIASEYSNPPYSIRDFSPSMYKHLEYENACDEYLQCPNSEDCESQSLEPEVKAFNSDFYRLCNLGSLRSLDSYSSGKTDATVNPDMLQKKLLLSPKIGRFGLRKTQELVTSKGNVSKTAENNQSLSEQNPPVRPTSFTSPLIPCDQKFQAFSRKDLNSTKCDASTKNVQTAPTSKGHTDTQRSGKRDITQLPSSDASLPMKKTLINANHFEVHSKLPVRKLTVTGKSLCNKEIQEVHSPQKKLEKSPQHRVSQRDMLLDYRTDAVSKRQQSRRERWNARRNRIKEGCGTAWIHLQTNADFADPNMRESLLDSVTATSSSDSSSSEEENEYLLAHNNSQLQRLCREKRQKAKASGKDDILAFAPRFRTSIVNCHDLYYRYGEQEEEAIACFDFLEDMPTSSESGSLELFRKSATYNANTAQYNQGLSTKGRLNAAVYNDSPSTNCTLPSKPSQFINFSSRLRLPGLWNKPLSHNMSSVTVSSQDCEFLDHISLSDSCAESYSSTPDSFEDAS